MASSWPLVVASILTARQGQREDCRQLETYVDQERQLKTHLDTYVNKFRHIRDECRQLETKRGT